MIFKLIHHRLNFSTLNFTSILNLVVKYTIIIFIVVAIAMIVYQAWSLYMSYRIGTNSIVLEVLPRGGAPLKDTEHLLRHLHDILINTKWRKLVFGSPYMSFEIVGKYRRIKFYIRIPADMEQQIVDRIYAAYPEIVIKQLENDYMPDVKGMTYYGSEMELGYNHLLKIKTKGDTDILPSILSGLKDLKKDEMSIVQFIVKPIDNRWQKEGRNKLARFEKDGIRIENNTNSSESNNKFSYILKRISKGLNDELHHEGINFYFGGDDEGYFFGNTKTKLDRKEITVASEKLQESGFETVIRVESIGNYKKGDRIRTKAITGAFNELSQENKFVRKFILNQSQLYVYLKNRMIFDRKNILTTSELANFFLRLPDNEIIDIFQDIESVCIKELPPPRNIETEKNILAVNDYHGKQTYIGIRDKDLVRHLIAQGSTGSGKSEWVKTLFLNHIKRGLGAMLLEPHGKLADEMLELIPEERRKDVVYFDLFDPYPPPFNFCKVQNRKGIDYEDLLEKTVEESVEIFKRAFSDVWSGKNEYYITNAIKTIIELQEGSMPDMTRLFVDKKFRQYAISKLKDTQLKEFWKNEFKENAKGQLNTSTESTVNSVMYKFGKFLGSKKLLRAVGQEDCIDMLDIINNNKIIIFRLAKDKMSEDRINFIGGIAIKLLIVSAFSRNKSKWEDPFMVVIDEAQNFISESIKDIVYELRKYGIALVMMHQSLEQLNKIKGLNEALYGNVGTKITFNVGKSDAPFFVQEYGPRVDETDLVKLPSRYGYCKLMVDGQKSETFNIYTLDRPEVSREIGVASSEEIKQNNRKHRRIFSDVDKMLEDRIINYRDIEETENINEEAELENGDEIEVADIWNQIKKDNKDEE